MINDNFTLCESKKIGISPKSLDKKKKLFPNILT